jgi:hypothetical protein
MYNRFFEIVGQTSIFLVKSDGAVKLARVAFRLSCLCQKERSGSGGFPKSFWIPDQLSSLFDDDSVVPVKAFRKYGVF